MYKNADSYNFKKLIVVQKGPHNWSMNTVYILAEFPISPDLEIVPRSKVYEGDQLNVYCAAKGSQKSDTVNVYLSRGSQLLESGLSKVNHTMEAPATEPAEFECRLQMGDVGKAVTKVVSVTGEWTFDIDMMHEKRC